MVGPHPRASGAPANWHIFPPTCPCTASCRCTTARACPMSPWFSPRSSGPAVPRTPSPARRCSSPADGEYAGLLVRRLSRRRPARTCARSGRHRQGAHRQLRPAQHHGSIVRPGRRLRRRHGHPAVASIGGRSTGNRSRPWPRVIATPANGTLHSWSQAAIRRFRSGLLPGERPASRAGSAGRRSVHRRGDAAAASAAVRRRAGRAPRRYARGFPRLAHHGGGTSRRLSRARNAFRPRRNWSKRAPPKLPPPCALAEYSAAIVMSHHLDSDLHYLRALARAPCLTSAC